MSQSNPSLAGLVQCRPYVTDEPPAATPKGSFGAYYLGAFLQPGRTFEALLADPRRLI